MVRCADGGCGAAQAEGEAEAIRRRAEAQAEAIALVAARLYGEGQDDAQRAAAVEAARLLVAKEVRAH